MFCNAFPSLPQKLPLHFPQTSPSSPLQIPKMPRVLPTRSLHHEQLKIAKNCFDDSDLCPRTTKKTSQKVLPKAIKGLVRPLEAL